MKFDHEFELLLQRLGQRIKEYREKSELTQEQMSEGSHPLEYKFYQKVEGGKRNITLRTLFKISKKLGIPLRDLLDIESKK